ncbi:hypothetical protein C4B24_00230 [Mycoplasma marinum]|uniref:Uncharacterized protein n=1 Tax=Mycoplasma marinum TaxID=1937190 RepID=A0A4R0XVX2_9MOLU|nr:hypothetical protein C4B24_00230 [Mycoplasma marinum]
MTTYKISFEEMEKYTSWYNTKKDCNEKVLAIANTYETKSVEFICPTFIKVSVLFYTYTSGVVLLVLLYYLF